jgi:hypothetical protein
MSYNFEKKVKPLPLTIKTLPKYTKFIVEHGMTPQQYVEHMEEKKQKGMREIDVKQFLSQEKSLAYRRPQSASSVKSLSPPSLTSIYSTLFPSELDQYRMRFNDSPDKQQKLKQVTYFNTDLNKYTTAFVPEKMMILESIRETSKDIIEIPPELSSEPSEQTISLKQTESPKPKQLDTQTKSDKQNEPSIFNSEIDDLSYLDKLVNYDQYSENLKRLRGGAPNKKQSKRLHKAYHCIQNGNFKDAEIIAFSMM